MHLEPGMRRFTEGGNPSGTDQTGRGGGEQDSGSVGWELLGRCVVCWSGGVRQVGCGLAGAS